MKDLSPEERKKLLRERATKLRERATKKLLTVEEVAASLFVSRATVNRMITDHQLPAVCLRSGRRKKILRVDEVDLQAFIESLKTRKDKNNALRLARNS
jgi:excisionase family DNA binding protein